MSFKLKTDKCGSSRSRSDKSSNNLVLRVVFHEHSNGRKTLYAGFLSSWTNRTGDTHSQGRTTHTDLGEQGYTWTSAKLFALAEELNRIPQKFNVVIRTDDVALLSMGARQPPPMAKQFTDMTNGRSVKFIHRHADEPEFETLRSMIAKTANKGHINENGDGVRRPSAHDFQPRMAG
jgi:hypothetical protein